MKRKTKIRLLSFALGILLLMGASVVLAQGPAASTTKILSTNFTLINFGTLTATVKANYFKMDGSPWNDIGAANDVFTVRPNGGQAIFRQYDLTQFPNLSNGRGSVIVSANQPLASVVQIQAVDTSGTAQVPSSGAYSAISAGSNLVYVPLVSRRGISADGIANSQVIIQNASAGAISVNARFIDFFTGLPVYTKTNIALLSGSSFYYDLDTETNLPEGFFGSLVVQTVDAGGSFLAPPAGKVVVVSNFFLGNDQLQTFNGFPKESVGTDWVAPLVTSRLVNNLSTPITVQNLSGHTLPAGAIRLLCKPDAASPDQTNLSISTPSPLLNNGSVAFNPVDVNNFAYTQFPDGWFGACRVHADDDVVVFVQMRFVGTGNAAAYEAMPANRNDTKVLVPLIAKRLTNGFATALTVQNLSSTQSATVTLTYVPSPDYIASGGSSNTIVVQGQIPPDGSFIQNHRIVGGAGAVPQLVDTWYGTVVVESSGPPIQAFVQLTNILATAGDTFMAHNAFTN